jgi:uncharacterized protein (TIGR02996 family)
MAKTLQQEAAFLAALNERPGDTVSRLVFADWLEERGDPRGQLLRLTHTLTQSVDVPGRAELEARMQALVDQEVAAVGPFQTNSLGMQFAWVPPGTFLMGSPAHENNHRDNEALHRVTLTGGFFLGVHPVTQAQWQAVMRKNPSEWKAQKRPVDCVNLEDCFNFCRKLSKREGTSYCLPTEAEWEYACRTGTQTAYHFGDDPSRLREYAWCSPIASKTQVVGKKKCNALGLHDMHGNIWEWCSDWFGKYPSNDSIDPQGPTAGNLRVVRGGGYADPGLNCRSAMRGYVRDIGWCSVGFRILFRNAE